MHAVKAEFSLPCRISEVAPKKLKLSVTLLELLRCAGWVEQVDPSYLISAGQIINLILSDYQIIRYRITHGDVIVLLPTEATQPARPQ
jgi:hypothetical protein